MSIIRLRHMFNILVNTFEGSKSKKTTKRVVRFLKAKKVDFLVYFVEHDGEFVDLVQRLVARGETDFINVGGDSSIYHIVNGLDLETCTLGLVRGDGTQNISNSLHISKNYKYAVLDILDGTKKKIDIIQCNDVRAINSISFGFTVEYAKRYTRPMRTCSLLSGLSAMKSADELTMDIELNDNRIKNAHFAELVVCNGTRFENNVKISPLSNLTDDRMNVLIFDKKNISDYVMLTDILNAKHIYNEYCKQYWVRDIKLKSNGDIMCIIDGVKYTADKFDIALINHALSVYVNKDIHL